MLIVCGCPAICPDRAVIQVVNGEGNKQEPSIRGHVTRDVLRAKDTAHSESDAGSQHIPYDPLTMQLRFRRIAVVELFLCIVRSHRANIAEEYLRAMRKPHPS